MVHIQKFLTGFVYKIKNKLVEIVESRNKKKKLQRDDKLSLGKIK